VQQVWAVMMKKTISIKPALLPIYNTVLLLLVAVHCLLEEKEDTTKRFAVCTLPPMFWFSYTWFRLGFAANIIQIIIIIIITMTSCPPQLT
jgi:hypothetical protein